MDLIFQHPPLIPTWPNNCNSPFSYTEVYATNWMSLKVSFEIESLFRKVLKMLFLRKIRKVNQKCEIITAFATKISPYCLFKYTSYWIPVCLHLKLGFGISQFLSIFLLSLSSLSWIEPLLLAGSYGTSDGKISTHNLYSMPSCPPLNTSIFAFNNFSSPL